MVSVAQDWNRLFRLELGFFEVLKVIAKRTEVYLTLPETFIFGFGFPSPSLICTDYETGVVQIHEGITQGSVYEACALFEERTHRRGGLPIAVHKLAATIYLKDSANPMYTSQEAFEVWIKYMRQSRAQVLQRYVQGGVIRPCVIKAIWDNEKISQQSLSNPPSSLPSTLSPESKRHQFLVLTHSSGVKTTPIRPTREIENKVKYLIMLLERYYLPAEQFKVTHMETDFILDERGTW